MKKALILFAVAVILSALCYITVLAEGYDSTTDPVITLSYINNNLLPQIDARISELQKLIDNGGASTGGSSGVDSAALNELGNRVSSLESRMNYLATNDSLLQLAARVSALENRPAGSSGASGSMQYTAIFVEYGKTLIAPTASVELILRSGSAVVVSPFADQGLSDITGGADLLNGRQISFNHALIIPRGGDGRGIKITSRDGAYVMVRGDYEIVN
jgi:hypothetical protein